MQFNHLPVKPLRVTSKFGKRNTNIQGASTYHKGIDLGKDFSKKETIIYSVAAGTVEKNYWHDIRGWVVVINHYSYKTLYQHLKQQSKVHVGKIVKAGESIGIMGSTSKSIKNMAEHLHFELIVNGENIDPLPYLENTEEITNTEESKNTEGITNTEESKNTGDINDMSRDEVIQLIKENLLREGEEPSVWSKDTWEKYKTAGITDGTNPRGYCTREQVIMMIDRAMQHMVD